MIVAGIVAFGLVVSLGGDDGFDGTFAGKAMGQDAVAELTTDGGDLRGTIRYAGVTGKVRGTIDGATAKGTVRRDDMGVVLDFEATLTDDEVLDWRYPALNIGLTLKRRASGGDAPAGSGNRDARLIGRWRRTASGPGAGKNRVIVSTDVHCTLTGDGTFVYGGATTGAVGPGHWPGVMVGPAGTTRGEWKTEGSTLYTRTEGGSWQPVGRYSVSGSGLVLYAVGGGEPTYWERN